MYHRLITVIVITIIVGLLPACQSVTSGPERTNTTTIFGIVIGLILVVLVILVVITPLVWKIYKGKWPEWTGYGEYTAPLRTNENFHRGKTLWDWLKLLIVPIVLTLGGLWYSSFQTDLQNIRDDRNATDVSIVEANRAAAQSTVEADREYANALEAYIDDMTSLISNEKTNETGEMELPSNVKELIQIRTRSVSNRLDGKRNESVLLFLQEARLLTLFHNDGLTGINLKEADLSRTNLENIDLSGADLTGANLAWADLSNVNFNDANLTGVDLRYAKLPQEWNLRRAILENVLYNNVTECPVSFELPEGAILILTSFHRDTLTCLENELTGNEKQLEILKSGVENWNDWRINHPEITPDFGKANFYRSDLRGANFRGIDLSEVTVQDALLAGVIYDSDTKWPEHVHPEDLAAAHAINLDDKATWPSNFDPTIYGIKSEDD